MTAPERFAAFPALVLQPLGESGRKRLEVRVFETRPDGIV